MISNIPKTGKGLQKGLKCTKAQSGRGLTKLIGKSPFLFGWPSISPSWKKKKKTCKNIWLLTKSHVFTNFQN